MEADLKHLLILLRTGIEDGGRNATLAFATALAACYTHTPVTVFLMGSAVCWARKDGQKRVAIRGYQPLKSYFNDFVMAGGKLCVSLPCLQYDESVDAVLAREQLIAAADLSGVDTLIGLSARGATLQF